MYVLELSGVFIVPTPLTLEVLALGVALTFTLVVLSLIYFTVLLKCLQHDNEKKYPEFRSGYF